MARARTNCLEFVFLKKENFHKLRESLDNRPNLILALRLEINSVDKSPVIAVFLSWSHTTSSTAGLRNFRFRERGLAVGGTAPVWIYRITLSRWQISPWRENATESEKKTKPDKLACDKETHEQVWAWILNDRYTRSRESPYNNASHFIMCEDSM